MPAASPGILELAFYLRKLRQERWPGVKLTQAALARALGGDEPLAPATVASWENRTAPKLPPADRVLAYAQFFATRRSLDSPEPALVPAASFTAEERDEHKRLQDDLLRLHAGAQGPAAGELEIAPRSWLFADGGKITLICAELPEEERPALAKPGEPNYTELLSFGDLDSMVELFGHVRAENPSAQVAFKLAPRVEPDDLSGHIAIIGGIAWNPVTARLLELTQLPVTQRADPDVPFGEIFIATVDGEERRFLPKWSGAHEAAPYEDVGLLVRIPNPLNSNQTLTMCNGVHSRGVYGVVRSLTDAQLRESNERYIAENFPDQKY